MNNKYKRKKKMYTEIVHLNLYIILFSDNNFYVGKTKHKNLKTVFRQHYHSNYDITEPYMEADKNKNYLPEIYYLESVDETEAMAYSRMLAWTALLKNNGYNCINGESFNSDAEDLEEHTIMFYNEIKDVDLEALLSKENSLYPDYKSKKQTTKKSKISINLDPEDYEFVEQKAAEVGLSKSAYCKQMALKGNIIHYQSFVSGEYLKEMRDAVSAIQQTVVTIYRLGQYFPKDLEKIENLKDIVEKHYAKMLDENSKINNKIYRKRN